MRAARENDEKERMSMKRNLKLLKKADDLDTSLFGIVESWLDIMLNENGNIITTDVVEDIAQSLSPFERIMVPGFFKRIKFPFRILRQRIFLHGFHPLDPDFMMLFDLSQRDHKNNLLKQQLMFLLFLVADVK